MCVCVDPVQALNSLFISLFLVLSLEIIHQMFFFTYVHINRPMCPFIRSEAEMERERINASKTRKKKKRTTTT